MVYFKSCRRCSGDLIAQRDEFGGYTTCLACGCVTYLDDAPKPSLLAHRVAVAASAVAVGATGVSLELAGARSSTA